MQFPAQAKGPQIHTQMGGARIGQRQVVVAQQRGHMGTAGLALGGVGQHDDVGNGQRRRHGLWRAGVDFVVQQHPVRVLRGADRGRHANPGKQISPIVYRLPYSAAPPHGKKQRHPKVPLLEVRKDGRERLSLAVISLPRRLLRACSSRLAAAR